MSPLISSRRGFSGVGSAVAARARLKAEVLAGLSRTPPQLPAKLFYDEAGARLFDAITRLDAYYLTRAEREILDARAEEIVSLIGPRRVLVEYGSGEAEKIRILLGAGAEHTRPSGYVPVDVSERQLENVAIELATRFPDLRVMPVTADFTARLRLPRQATGPEGHVAVFFGSTIGNLHPPEAAVLLRSMAQRAGPRGAILLGVDLRKDPGLLHLAYNDPEGVTAAFNRNVLVHLNRELGATFDPDGFAHSAYFNSTASRIEMHLVASRPQVVSIGERRFRFEAGDGIWTESSYKYTWVGIERLAGAAGLIVRRRWTDRQNRFALVLLQTAGA